VYKYVVYILKHNFEVGFWVKVETKTVGSCIYFYRRQKVQSAVPTLINKQHHVEKENEETKFSRKEISGKTATCLGVVLSTHYCLNRYSCPCKYQ